MGGALRKIGDVKTNSKCRSSCCNVEKSYILHVCNSCGHMRKIYSDEKKNDNSFIINR